MMSGSGKSGREREAAPGTARVLDRSVVDCPKRPAERPPVGVAGLLRLQALAGNRAVGGLLRVQRRPWRLAPVGPSSGAYVDDERGLVYMKGSRTLKHKETGDVIEVVAARSPRELELLTEIEHDVAQPRFLDDLVPKADLGNWNAGKEELVGAHHKFPKSPLAWLFEHMTPAQQGELRKTLWLPPKAGPAALARLRSLLISPRTDTGRLAHSEHRADDPHHNRDASPPGEEGLDLMHRPDGSLTPRSREVKGMAGGVVKLVYAKYRALEAMEAGKPFVVSDDDFVRIRDHLLRAEELHHAIEPDPTLPSHSSGDAWASADGGQFSKRRTDVAEPPAGMSLGENYASKRKHIAAQADTRREIVARFLQWRGRASANEAEDLVKCDFNGQRGGIVRYIHGVRRGQAVPGVGRVDDWQTVLERFAAGTVEADEIPWLQALFV